MRARLLIEQLLHEAPTTKTLEKHRQELSPAERKQLKDAGKSGATVWKATVDGKTYYVVHTHRAGVVRSSMKGVLAIYDWVESTG